MLKKAVAFKINHDDGQNVSPAYVNNLMVQHTEDEFLLSFFFVQAPTLVAESTEALLAEASQHPALPAKCVAKLAISPRRMESFVSSLQENLVNYRAKLAALQAEREEKGSEKREGKGSETNGD